MLGMVNHKKIRGVIAMTTRPIARVMPLNACRDDGIVRHEYHPLHRADKLILARPRTHTFGNRQVIQRLLDKAWHQVGNFFAFNGKCISDVFAFFVADCD